MDLTQLKYFLEVAKKENMTAAAEALYISQPSLSNSIARLEKELGYPLFDRSRGHSIQLNAYGKAFLHRAANALREIESGLKEMEEISEGEDLNIRISVSIHDLLPYFLGDYVKLYSEDRIVQYYHTPDKALQSLLQGETDMILTWEEMTDAHVRWEPLFEDDTFLIVSEEHPLASRTEVTLAELAGEKFIINNTIHGYQEMIEQHCREAGFTPNTVYQGNDPLTASMMLNLNRGIALQPAHSVILYSSSMQFMLHTKHLRITEPDLKQTVGIATLQGQYMPAASARFYRYIKEQLSTIGGRLEFDALQKEQ